MNLVAHGMSPVLVAVLTDRRNAAWSANVCAAVVFSEDADERTRVVTDLLAGPVPEGVALHENKPGLSRFVILAAGSTALKADPDEVSVWGARGDRRTTGVLIALMIFAWLHRLDGHPGPCA